MRKQVLVMDMLGRMGRKIPWELDHKRNKHTGQGLPK